MDIHVWSDETSDALQKANPTAATCWKLSNFCGLAALGALSAAVLLIIAVIVLSALAGPAYGSPADASLGGMTAASNCLNSANCLTPVKPTLLNMLPVLALLLIILSSICIQLYGISLAIVAWTFKDYAWAAGSVLFWPVAAIYGHVKGKEIRKGVERKG